MKLNKKIFIGGLAGVSALMSSVAPVMAEDYTMGSSSTKTIDMPTTATITKKDAEIIFHLDKSTINFTNQEGGDKVALGYQISTTAGNYSSISDGTKGYYVSIQTNQLVGATLGKKIDVSADTKMNNGKLNLTATNEEAAKGTFNLTANVVGAYIDTYTASTKINFELDNTAFEITGVKEHEESIIVQEANTTVTYELPYTARGYENNSAGGFDLEIIGNGKDAVTASEVDKANKVVKITIDSTGLNTLQKTIKITLKSKGTGASASYSMFIKTS